MKDLEYIINCYIEVKFLIVINALKKEFEISKFRDIIFKH